MTSQMALQRRTDLLYDASKNNANSTPTYGHFEKLFLSDWRQAKIHGDIVQAFNKMGIEQMKPIQKNSFLYLMNKYNIAMVGFSKGKSISYLTSICSSILNDKSNRERGKVIGPKAIIISNSLNSCSSLDDLLKQLTNNNKIKTVVAYSYTPVKQIIATLWKGCDILIATPTSLIGLLAQTKQFSWLNLRHFVFDNLDILLDNYKDQMDLIFAILTKRNKNTTNLQMISASVKWTKNMDGFLNSLFVKWQYIFGSHIEAARYMKIGFHVVHTKGDKLKQISEFLKNKIKYCRCVLISSNPDEIDIISKYISQNNSNIDVLLPGQMKCDKVFTVHKWNEPLKKSQCLMICSDDMMSDFYIDKSDCLIHYDIPNVKRIFSTRFSVLQDSNNTFLKKDLNTYIFLSNSSEDMLQLPKVVEVMKTFGDGELDPILLKHAKIINDTLEKEKKNCLLCKEIKQFGYCTKRMTCQSRHILLKEIDDPDVIIPKSGLAIVKVLKVYDASHMSVKLLKLNCTNNLNDKEHWKNVEDNSDSINLELNSFYSNPNSRILPKNPKPGDMVAIESEANVGGQINTNYFRAVVLSEVIYSTKKSPIVSVKLIDEGIDQNVQIRSVFVLPDVLKCIPTTTVDVFLVSVKPADLDKTWNDHANTCVQKKLQLANDCKDNIIVKIEMALGTTVWIKNLYKKYWNSKLKTYAFETLLPDILVDAACADKNVDHLPNLLELCKLADIYLPTLKKNVQENRELSLEEFMTLYKLPKPQWAHLDDQKSTLVSVDFVISPKMIFVRNSKYNKNYIDLQDKIECYIKQNKVDNLKHIIKGAICLAKHPELNRYNRGQIIEILNDTSVEILFVDTGDFHDIKSNSLLTITPNLIIQLPFQIIECGLSGVKDIPTTGKELEELIEYIFNLAQHLLYIKAVHTISSAKFTGGNHYEVALYDNDIIVNFELHSKFSQYFDSTQLLELEHFLNNDGDEIVENNHDECGFDENICLEYVDSVNSVADEFFNQFALDVFGKSLKDMIVVDEPNVKYKNQENTEKKLKITEITPNVTPEVKNKLSNDLIKVKPVEEVKSMHSAVPERSCLVLNKDNLKQKHLCLTCNNNTRSVVPMCSWYQDINNIYLKLDILQIDDYSINCTVESITFNGQFNDISYAFCVELYGYIYDHNVTCNRSYEGFIIKAEKLVVIDMKWPRLFSCDKWHKYLKYDPEHIKIKDPDLVLKMKYDINRYKMKALGVPLNIETDDVCTSTDESDDELDDTIDF